MRPRRMLAQWTAKQLRADIALAINLLQQHGDDVKSVNNGLETSVADERLRARLKHAVNVAATMRADGAQLDGLRKVILWSNAVVERRYGPGDFRTGGYS